ncbi:hypothetical protein Nmel_006135 [Mimus melanotis]
MHRALSRH